jgi:tetratricopeptide (TPR) repeat protein
MFSLKIKVNMKRIKIIVSIFALFLVSASYMSYGQTAPKIYKAGVKFMKEKNYTEALNQINQAIQMDSSQLDYFVSRANCYENLGQLPEATRDYIKAADLDPKDKELAYNAGRLLNAQTQYIESIHWLSKALDIDKSYLVAMVTKIGSLIAIKNFDEALSTSNKTLELKKSSLNYYNHGIVSDFLKNYQVAETDLKEAINLDKEYYNAYVALASVLLKSGKTEEALKYCNDVLKMDANFTEAYATRSKIYYKKSDLPSAIADLTKAIYLNSTDANLYFTRAQFQKEFAKVKEAINDYTQVTKLDDKNYMAFYNRALCYEETKNPDAAATDFEKFIALTQNIKDVGDLYKNAETRVYELRAETNKPEIVIKTPTPTADGAIETSKNSKELTLEASITDQSKLKSIKINGQDCKYDNTTKKITVSQEVKLESVDKISVVATDIYNNETTLTLNIKRTEVDPPLIDIIQPYTSQYNEIFLEQQDSIYVFIEGKIADESLIKSIVVDGMAAKYLPGEKNPTFSATIDATGKNEIKVEAIDEYGNATNKTFKLDRTSAKILAENPMGKTWVVFIENSDYVSFASLVGPTQDVVTIKNALSKYDVHNFIQKKNQKKVELEKFFSIELRDLVKNNKVNSLIVWYAGHGKFINETGYWIPVDADRDDEYTYFNISNLKAAMQSYSKFVTHVLVITDACESGPTFYAAMRSGAKKRVCGDYEATKFKSSQVFSSAGLELAQDKSQFTSLFAKQLNYNTNDCIAIDNIVIGVTESVTNEKQKPQFGQIQGLEDEGGTFFFMKKK